MSNALRAVKIGTSLNSYKILPGLMTATQYSGAPLPEPIRVSAARLVIDLSGKVRINNRPLRLV